MSEALSLSFPEIPISRKGDLTPMVRKFEHLAEKEDSPIRAIRRTPARAAEFGDFPESMNPRLREVLQSRGIMRPWSHQAEAYQRITSGANVVIVTPTASG